MALNIKLNNGFSVIAKENCFQLMKTKVKSDKSEKKAGEEFLDRLGDYTSIESMCNGYLFHSALHSDCKSIVELIALVKEVRAELKVVYTVNLKDL